MIKNLLEDDGEPAERPKIESGDAASDFSSDSDTSFDREERSEKPEPFVLSSAQPESFAETTRKSGLAWSAGIAFFGSVVFTMVLGWLADRWLGSSPWGIVGGIVLGSMIGFIQFFRITSQIFRK